MNKSKFLFIFLTSIMAGLLIAIVVMAWTNPTGNPTSGGGALYYSGGNVGIGTINPSQKLDVSGQIHATGDICTDQGGGKCLSTQQATLNLNNCAWTGWSGCGAASAGQDLVCPADKVMRGFNAIGCSEGGCADSTRCEKYKLYCYG